MIAKHQESSPTTIFSIVKRLVNGTERIVYELTLIKNRIRTLEKANEALSKHRRAKRTYIQDKGTCTGDVAQILIVEKEAKRSKR